MSIPRAYRFLIVDDHPVTRAGTRSLLERNFVGCTCEDACDLASLRQALAMAPWSLILLDHQLPDGSGMDFLREASLTHPVLMLTVCDDRRMRLEAMKAGARGFSSKSDDPVRILAAIESILAGKHSFESVPREPPSLEKPLSEREHEVLRALLDGKRLVEIAKLLDIQPTSVQSYKKRLMEKFNASTIPELVKEALRRGFR
ncbi:MAG: response regulator transcription factor [Fibrobacterota bacterium]|nr:MAG: response regulator transcription factor [Fibrobacterota bacterium]